MADPYVEPGGSWRPFWLVTAAIAGLHALDVVRPGPGVPALVQVLAAVVVLGVVGAGCLTSRRVWTVRVDGPGTEGALRVGREQVPLSDVDTAHLREVRQGSAGVDAGAPVLGGGWTLPRGRTGLPLRLTDGRTVLVPTRDPAGLAGALLARSRDIGNTPGGGAGHRGTLDP